MSTFNNHYKDKIPEFIFIFYDKNGFITYDMFLTYRNEFKKNSSIKVQIICQYCHKEKYVTVSFLTQRKHKKFEQICQECYIHQNNLTGFYHGIKFESSYELAFLYSCYQNKLNVKRCNINIPYENKTFHPDFIINNTIFEIKGKESTSSDKKKKAARIFCKKHNMVFCFINEEILLNLIPFDLNSINFYQNFLNDVIFFNIPLTKHIKKANDYLGFIYKCVDLKNNKTHIHYQWGEVHKQLCDDKYHHMEILYCFNSFFNLIKFYYEYKHIFNDNYVSQDLYIPKIIQLVFYRNFNNFSTCKTAGQQQFYDLFNVVIFNKQINLLNLNHDERINVVKKCTEKNIPQKTLNFLKSNRIYRELANVKRNKTLTKIFDKQNNLIRTYLYNNDLFHDFDLNTYKLKGLENFTYLRFECKIRKNVKPIDLFLTNGEYIIEFNCIKLLYPLFGIVYKTYKKIVNTNQSFNGFYLKSK